MTIKVMLVDDHRVVREGVKNLLEMESDLSIIADTGDGREAIKIALEKKPDVVLMDIGMPDINGIEAARQIIKSDPKIKVIILSMHVDKVFISRAFSVGVSGYLLKDCDIDEIVQAIKHAAANRNYISPMIAGSMIEEFRDLVKNTEGEKDAALTAREQEILQLIATGKTSKEIGINLNVSPKTIETHRQQIMTKLDIHTIAGLTRYAIKSGISV